MNKAGRIFSGVCIAIIITVHVVRALKPFEWQRPATPDLQKPAAGIRDQQLRPPLFQQPIFQQPVHRANSANGHAGRETSPGAFVPCLRPLDDQPLTDGRAAAWCAEVQFLPTKSCRKPAGCGMYWNRH